MAVKSFIVQDPGVSELKLACGDDSVPFGNYKLNPCSVRFSGKRSKRNIKKRVEKT
jgi:hypothetical protein